MHSSGAYSLLHPADVAAINAYCYRLAAVQDRLSYSVQYLSWPRQTDDDIARGSRCDDESTRFDAINNSTSHVKITNGDVKNTHYSISRGLPHYAVTNTRGKNYDVAGREKHSRDVCNWDSSGISNSFDVPNTNIAIGECEHSPLDHLSLLTPTGVSSLSRTMSAVTADKIPSLVPEKRPNDSNNARLKFGINRILADDFGCTKKHAPERVADSKRQSHYTRHNEWSSGHERSLSMYISSCPFIYDTNSSLRAVHAIQPPNYQPGISDDGLPGPYSVLSADTSPGSHKRKRSWSRAVFSQLQRKGLEKRFDVQKYVTKPDRRKLAATLGLTDAQVKVWFQNRRMKWRHAEKIEEVTQESVKTSDTNGKICDNTIEVRDTRDDASNSSEMNEADDSSASDLLVTSLPNNDHSDCSA